MKEINKRNKALLGVYHAPAAHWVGDAFHVRSLFTYNNHGRYLNPFLLLDRAGPTKFEASDKIRGVGSHPHRGFETVTLVYEGEVAHRDSTGEGGTIGAGDVQWMTAARGILHEEMLSESFSQKGGVLDMVQLWVNLPAEKKMDSPRYQQIIATDIPQFSVVEGGLMRIIAGQYPPNLFDDSIENREQAPQQEPQQELQYYQGPANTATPVDLWDLVLQKGVKAEILLPENRYVGIVVLKGEVRCNGEVLKETDLAILEREGNKTTLEAINESSILILSGEMIDEPVVGHGPFVMNTREEIKQASLDFMSGKFGEL